MAWQRGAQQMGAAMARGVAPQDDDDVLGDSKETLLTADTCGEVDEAHQIFGATHMDVTGNQRVVLVLRPGRSSCKPYITVPEGSYGLVQAHGADLDYPGTGKAVWPTGRHAAAPYIRVSHLITKQAIMFDTPVKGCKTADNVTVQVDLCLILRIMGDEARGEDPELVRRFVYNLGPRG